MQLMLRSLQRPTFSGRTRFRKPRSLEEAAAESSSGNDRNQKRAPLLNGNSGKALLQKTAAQRQQKAAANVKSLREQCKNHIEQKVPKGTKNMA